MSGRRASRLLALIAVAALALAGCRFPDDVEGSLDRAEGGTLRVGVIADPPWTVVRGEKVSGLEATLIERFAAQIDAEVAWHVGAESELFAALSGFQLDVVIGGITRSSPYAVEAALTRPYVDTEIEIGVPPGTSLPDELGGVEIQVERGSEAAALLKQEEEDAIPAFYETTSEIDGPALLHSYELLALGYDSTNYILRDDEHAMAVPLGENALLTELEHFLLDRGAEAERMLNEQVATTIRKDAP